MRRNYYFDLNIRLLVLGTLFLFISSVLTAQSTKDYDPIIEKYSSQFGVDKDLVKSLIQVSSGGNPKAVSASGAVGLMQLPPSIIKGLGIRNAYDADENIRGGCSLLKNYMNQFSSTEMAIAAFNAGPNEVQKFGKVPPYAETKKFVEAVMKKFNALKESEEESKLFGYWKGTAKYTKYVSNPPLDANIVGRTQPFDLEIIPYGSGVILKTTQGQMGDPKLLNTTIENNKLHVEYSGPNPFAVPIPNATMTHTLSYVLDVVLNKDVLRGSYTSRVTSKVVYNIPELKLPEAQAEINFIMVLDLKK